jgi:nucleoside-diphosphate-sugar epimerase
MNILLTGATGFLGSHLLKAILTNSNDEVCIAKRTFSNTNRIEEELKNDRVSFFDIDTHELEDVFNENKFDSIIHTATEYGRSGGSIHKILGANIVFPIALIELAIKFNVKTFINTDSYFNKEESNYSNLLNYSLSKRSLLVWLKKLSDRIQIINVSLEHMYGPHDNQSKFVEMLFQEIALNKIDRVKLTYGHQKRDFIFIDDITNAYLTLIKYGNDYNFSYKRFEIGSGKSIEVRQLALMIKELSNSPTVLGFGDIEYRPDEMMSSAADIKPIEELGWNCNISLRDGVKNILQLYQSGINQ